MTEPQPGDAARQQRRLADLLRRRADVYHPARQAPSYYGDDDIDLLRSMLDAAQSALAESRSAHENTRSNLRRCEQMLIDRTQELARHAAARAQGVLLVEAAREVAGERKSDSSYLVSLARLRNVLATPEPQT